MTSFQTMTSSTNKLTPISCDLVTNSILHRSFLEKIHELGVSDPRRQRSYESLRRYSNLWLPLVYYHPTTELIPPPDIAWLWHCHRLAPRNYVEYVTKRFHGVVLEARPPFVLQSPDVVESEAQTTPSSVTRSLWNQAYGKSEPFFLSDSGSKQTISPPTVPTLGRFDLLGSTQRQATFLWQISGERFNDDDFLKEGCDNYIKFLKLSHKASKRGIMLVPTFQIDLMWHTHMLTSTSKYNEDCVAIMGVTFNHDDDQSDRTVGGVLDNAYRRTKQLWKEEYGTEYAVPGGMYRGEPPISFFTSNRMDRQQLRVSIPIVEMGASSASPAGPQRWADIKGKASDGRSAFIPAVEYNKKALLRRDKYILGRLAPYGVGYYHLETREANIIIARRMAAHCRKLESEIAMEECCCGSTKSIIALKSRHLQASILQAEMMSRCRALKPSGIDETTIRNLSPGNESTSLYSSAGVWLYPLIIWDNCGGACGGAVYCSPSACGGTSVAGANRACSGGCGGGGCGGTRGGGCGGTNSGGGGCGGTSSGGGGCDGTSSGGGGGGGTSSGGGGCGGTSSGCGGGTGSGGGGCGGTSSGGGGGGGGTSSGGGGCGGTSHYHTSSGGGGGTSSGGGGCGGTSHHHTSSGGGGCGGTSSGGGGCGGTSSGGGGCGGGC